MRKMLRWRTPKIPDLLHDRAFRRYWSGQTVSMFGDQISSIALPLVAVLALHAGPADMGFLTGLVWLPSLLFGMHAGAWVDRRGRRRATMITADLGRFALLASIPVSYAFDVLTIGQLYGVAFGVGVLSVLPGQDPPEGAADRRAWQGDADRGSEVYRTLEGRARFAGRRVDDQRL